MRLLFILFYILLYTRSFSQDDAYPQYFQRTRGIKTVRVKRDCPACQPKEEKALVQIFHFNTEGFNTSEEGVHNGKKAGMQKFFWNSDGTINRYQNYNTFYYGDDSLEYNSGGTWDSTYLTNEVRYTYANSKLKTISWLNGDGDKLQLSTVTDFHYNSQGKLIKEETTDYNQSATDKTINYRRFQYAKDSIYIVYYNNGRLSGRGKKKTDKAGRLLYEATYDVTGALIFNIKNSYDASGKLIGQTRFETGNDGFGNQSDYVPDDLIKYEYDSAGRLKIRTTFYKNELSIKEYYEYR